MPLLDKAALLAGQSCPETTLHVAELGGDVRLRGMTAADRDAWEVSRTELQGKVRVFNRANFRASVVVRCVIDADGRRVFSDDDIEAVGQIRADVLDRLYDAAAGLSGISRRDEAELGKG